MSWQATLLDILTGYFADLTFDEGIREMVLVTENSPEYHRLYLSTLDAAIEAAARGDPQVVDVVKHSSARYVMDTREAGEYLARIRDEYRAHYVAAQRDIPPYAPG